MVQDTDMSLSGHVIASKHKDNDNHDDDNEMVGAECKQKKTLVATRELPTR